MDVNIPAYLITMGISAVCSCALFYFSLRRRPEFTGKKALPLGICVFLLGTVLAVLGAKLLYFIFNFSYLTEQGAGKFWLSLRTEEMSYYGGVGGVCLAVMLSARFFHLRPVKVLNTFAPAGALMAAAVRLAEYFLFPTGTGEFLDDPLPFPLAIYIENYEMYVISVFALEAIFALVAFVLSLYHRNEPQRFLRTLFYLCLPQVLLESLRSDSIRLLFVRMEQLTCFLVAEGILVWYGWKGGRRNFASWIPALAGILVCGLTITEEFMLDGKILIGGEYVPQLVTYSLMAAGLAFLAVMEHRANRRLLSLQDPEAA